MFFPSQGTVNDRVLASLSYPCRYITGENTATP